MATVTMTMEEYLQLLNGLSSDSMAMQGNAQSFESNAKPKKKISAYTRRYRANFRKIESNYKKKDGSWMKNGFKRAVQEAHRMSKK